MLTGFDLLLHSRALQLYWLRRWVAFAIDLVIVLLPVWAALALLGAPELMILAGLYSGLFLFSYSAVLEMHWGRTLGKAAVGLQVARLDGRLTLRTVLVRNAARFFWYVLPLIDFLLGLATEGDARQRLTERVLGSVVHHEGESPVAAGVAVTPAGFAAVSGLPSLECRACGGTLTEVGDETYQCARCGQIQ